MRKSQELTDALKTEYLEKIVEGFPKLVLKKNPMPPEAFSANYSAKTLIIEASSPIGHSYGISKLTAAIKGNHLADYLGKSIPRFLWRPIWLKAAYKVEVNEHISLHLPEFMCAADAVHLTPRFCRRLIECGYNSIVIGSQLPQPSLKLCTNKIQLKLIFEQLREQGIKIIVKPSFNLNAASICPYDPEFQKNIKSCIDLTLGDIAPIDSIFWESLSLQEEYRNHSQALDATDAELLLAEIRTVEKAINKRAELIFFLPSPLDSKKKISQAKWMNLIIDEMSPGSTLAFNAVQGTLYDDHSDNHPIWELLREAPDTSAIPWMPIINFGLVRQGEGLWPLTNFDLVDRFIPRCHRHHFAGVISLSSYLPQPGSLLDCNLWVAGQSLWSCKPSSLFAETWFKAFRPEEDRTACLDAFKKAREIGLTLSRLRSLAQGAACTGEEARMHGELLLAQLKHIRWLWDSKNGPTSHFKAYFSYFSRDVKQLTTTFLPTFSLPLSHLIDHQEPATSFWAHSNERPHREPQNKQMEAIFNETCLF